MIDPIDLPDLSRWYGLAQGSYLSGCWYQTHPSAALSTNAASGNGNLRVAAFPVPRGVTVTTMAAEVTAAGDAGSMLRLGIYADDGKGYPGALVLDAGTVAADVVGVNTLAVSNLILRPGLYWAGAAVQGVTTTQPTIRTITTPVFAAGVPLTTGTTPIANNAISLGFVATAVTGALPATFPTTKNLSAVAARVMFKVT